MRVQELADQCQEVIHSGGECVILVRTDGKLLLCGTYGPRGELLCVNATGSAVVRYKAKAVLRFIQNQAHADAGLK